MTRLNIIERQPNSELIMIQLLQGKLTHQEVADQLGCSRSNITSIVSKAEKRLRQNAGIVEFQKVTAGTGSQEMVVKDLEGNVKKSLQNITKNEDGTYDFDALDALKAIFVRLEKELVATADFDIQAKGAILKLQVDLATKLANMEPPEEKVNINELLEQSDRIRRFVPWLDERVGDQIDVRELFFEFLEEIGGDGDN